MTSTTTESTEQPERIDPPPSFDLPLTNEAALYLQPIFFDIAKRFTKCDSTADDWTQEVFVVVLEGKRKWSNPVVLAQAVILDRLKADRLWLRAAPIGEWW